MLATRPKLKIIERKSDIFHTPPNTTTLLIHACNAQGTWGAGIAKAFHDRYPRAFQIYKAHCTKHKQNLLGTALLIPVTEKKGAVDDSELLIGCLFTSVGKGRRKGDVESIVEATKPAMMDLLRQFGEWNEDGATGEKKGVGEVRMCKINSGLFGVPWERTREVLEGLDAVEKVEEIIVIERS